MPRHLLVLAFVSNVVGCISAPSHDTPAGSSSCETCAGSCRVEHFAIGQASHTSDPIDYPDRPPTGGAHNPCWATWGAHTSELADERWVHNLEHGGIVFLYNCTDCEADVADLTAWASTLGSTAVLTPYSLMDSRFAAVTWGTRLLLDCYDRAAFTAFYAEHVDHAPESTRAPPPCAN